MKNQTGRKVKVLRSDNRGEYTSKKFKDYLASKSIKHQLSILGRPEQNGVARIGHLQSVPAVSDYMLICQKDFEQRR